MRQKHLMWDIDGTLILTGGAGGNAMIQVIKDYYFLDANKNDFLAPKSMKQAFDNNLINKPETMKDYFKCAYKSLALSYKQAINELENNTGIKYEKLYIVGGGAKNAFLNKLTSEYTGKQIIALPIEATAIGNLRVQMEE